MAKYFKVLQKILLLQPVMLIHLSSRILVQLQGPHLKEHRMPTSSSTTHNNRRTSASTASRCNPTTISVQRCYASKQQMNGGRPLMEHWRIPL